MATIDVQLFQIPSVKLDGAPVAFPFKRVDALFYYLLCQGATTRQELVDLLWQDCPEETGYKNLRHTIYTLRKILGADLVLTTSKTEVRLNPERAIICDFHQPLPGNGADAGRFLQGFTVKNAPNFNAWVDQVREQLSARQLSGLSAAAAAALERGDLAEAERLGLDYLNRDGLDENMVMLLMKLYRQDGRFYKAASLYQRLKGKLAEELGIAPLQETAALYYEIVNQWNQTAAGEAAAASPLTGSRGALLEKIRRHTQQFLAGYPAASLLFYGEAGCGKSYLLRHFLQTGGGSGALVLSAGASQREAGSYLAAWKPVMLAVAEELSRKGLPLPERTRRTIARVFPVFSEATEAPRAACGFVQTRCGALVADAVALLLALVADGGKLLLVLEDLQWMDPASQDLLCQVLRVMGGSQLLLLSTSRTLNVDVNFLADEALLERVFVPCLTEDETAALLESLLGRAAPPSLRNQLYAATAGNPRLLAEAAEGLQGKDFSSASLPDPSRILRQRTAGLSENAARLVSVLALFRDQAPCRLLSAVTGFSAEALYPLTVELEEHALAREICVDGESYLSFLHPHMRDALEQAQSYFQRQPVHLQIADYLESHLRRGHSEVLYHLSYHAQAGGDARRAVRYGVEFWDAYTRAACAIPPMAPPSRLPEGLAPESLADRLEQDLALARLEFPSDAALDRAETVLQCARARYLIFAGRYQEGLALTERLLSALTPCPAEDTGLLLRVLRQRVAYDLQTDQQDSHCVVHGLDLASRWGDRTEHAEYLLLRGISFCKQGSYESAAYFLTKALEQLEDPQTHYPDFAACAHTWQGEILRRQENFPAACAAYETALALAPFPSRPGRAFLQVCYGRAALALGEDQQARALFSQALEDYAATGELPGRCLAQAYLARYAAGEGRYEDAAVLLSASRESASLLGSLVEQGIRDSVLAHLRRELDQRGDAAGPLHRYLYRPLGIYCHRGLQRLRGIPGTYEIRLLEDCLRFSVRQAKPLAVENLYSKNKNFMTE